MFKLEIFDIDSALNEPNSQVDPSTSELDRLETFEKGYKAGWDDACESYANEKSQISSELAKNLHDLSFSYHEARVSALDSTTTLLKAILEGVLPGIIYQSLTANILRECEKLLAEYSETQVKIKLSSDSLEKVSEIMPSDIGFPLTLNVDPSLGSGQAILVFSDFEVSVDVAQTIQEIFSTIGDFQAVNMRAIANE